MGMLRSETDLKEDANSAQRRSRAAKDNSATKSMIQTVLNDNDDDPKRVPGLDDDFSDDDKTWKPKEKQDDKLDDNGKQKNDSNALALYNPTNKRSNNSIFGNDPSAKAAKMSSQIKSPLVGISTELIPDEQDLKIGDFVVLKADVDKENTHIWRYDCHATLQRYNPLQAQSGKLFLHKSANIFSGFLQSDRAKFSSVSVKFLSADATSYTVKILSKAGGSQSDPHIRAQSMKETEKHQEEFEVYIQALISHCLDPNFLEEVISDNDEYFLNNIEKINAVTKGRLKSIMGEEVKSWPPKFMQSIFICPTLTTKDAAIPSQITKCGACDTSAPSYVLSQLSGKPYKEATLKQDKSQEDKNFGGDYNLCKRCNKLSDVFHQLTHQKHLLFTVCQGVIESRKKSSLSMENSANLLNDLLADTKWLEEQFGKMQDTWADASCLAK